MHVCGFGDEPLMDVTVGGEPVAAAGVVGMGEAVFVFVRPCDKDSDGAVEMFGQFGCVLGYQLFGFVVCARLSSSILAGSFGSTPENSAPEALSFKISA